MPQISLLELITNTLEDAKALDVTTLSVAELTSVTDHMVICTATSARHAIAIADRVIEAAKANDFRPFGSTGEDTGEWVLVDFIDVVVHIMQGPIREHYDLEKLWDKTLIERGEELQ
jgi:ribosome-associated protein